MGKKGPARDDDGQKPHMPACPGARPFETPGQGERGEEEKRGASDPNAIPVGTGRPHESGNLVFLRERERAWP